MTTLTERRWTALRPSVRVEKRVAGRAYAMMRVTALSGVLTVVASMSLASLQVSDASANPGWALSGATYPTHFSPSPPSAPGVSGTVAIDVMNIGSTAAGCTAAAHTREVTFGHLKQPQCPSLTLFRENPFTVTDELPTGVRAVEAGDLISADDAGLEPEIGHALWACTGNGPGPAPNVEGATVVTCVNKAKADHEGEQTLEQFPGGGGSPTFSGHGAPNQSPVLAISVDVQPGAAEHETNTATIAGGGAPASAETSDPVIVSATPPPYEVTDWNGWFSNADGSIDDQAGSHPYMAYFTLNLATMFDAAQQKADVSGSELRTAEIELPRGFVGDPTALPQCSRELFVAEHCSIESMIGTTTVTFANLPPFEIPVFNLAPPAGIPAEFGFSLQGLNTFLDASVRTGSDNGVNEHVSTVAHKEIMQAITTLWGEPGDSTHNRWRNGTIGGCTQAEMEESGNLCTIGGSPPRRPLLTLPSSCGEDMPFVLHTTSYAGTTSERTFYMHDQDEKTLTLDGCDNLAFGPTISVAPETSATDSPTGLMVDVTPSVAGLQHPEGLNGAEIRNTKVSLPTGFVLNPGVAASLQACTTAQANLSTVAELAAGAENSSAPACPPASKVGTAKASSPILEGAAEKELRGNVYVLSSNPPHLKLLAALSADGVDVKLVLNAELNEATGQIVTSVENAPELPVSDFALEFAGGERASVVTPTHCGLYESPAEFLPWTSPIESSFIDELAVSISMGPGGSACPAGQLPLSPTLSAGSTGPVAGAFTGLSATVSRGDGQQRIGSLQFKAPLGLAAMISSVPLCPEAHAAVGTCEEGSLIGHATVASGPGAHPLVIPQPGNPAPGIFLTGPYEGAPFGVSIVTRVLAGPFDLGTIVTRGRIEVDRSTAQVTVTTDTLPQIIDGVPTDLRLIGATVDRPGFVFNPTSCQPMAISGAVTGVEGASVAVSSHFQVTNCAALKFAPKLSASTAGKASKAGGTSLDVKVAYPSGPEGTYANIKAVKVDLPKQLPSRLTTLQKACLASVFEANPANCPSASNVGMAVARTPVLSVPLMGPAYLVSHGGEAFPDLEIVLQGEGVTLILDGSTQIKKGITSSTFKAVPDAPVSSFELKLPAGKFSILGANVPQSAHYSLCGQTLNMPTQITAQNGAVLKQATKIAVTGCAKKAVKKKRGSSKKGKGKRGVRRK
jgi:hypothetical protein